MKKTLILKKTALAVITSAFVGGAAFAGPFESSVTVEKRIDKASASSQSKIDKLAEQAADAAFEYRNTLSRVDSLETFNTQLRRQVRSQEESISNMGSEMESIDETEKGVLPLMDEMIKTLEQFVELDIPFNLDRRTQRVADLNKMMDNADISVSEKYRKILEAYQIEMGYGNVMQSTSGSIDRDGQTLEVDFLRVGRTAYIYLSKDRKSGRYWNKADKQWAELPVEYIDEVSEAMKMADGIVPVEMFKIPVRVAEAAQ
ncbi:DUF3450 domain-containing protein [Kangiella sp. HZ709]|uniref:DUF3450 domain-containing protein n=1 Tax=Kangiella sp. HZ709 TaxID=2666328 RepID=UPI0012B0118D|nr:DUF3450 domain-containing protein [Kangiella sp. HZ709]MRX28481.1 DUF3450 family protein [Kangiella sp. HZ709]